MVEAGEHLIQRASFVLHGNNQRNLICVRYDFRFFGDNNKAGIIVAVAIDGRRNNLQIIQLCCLLTGNSTQAYILLFSNLLRTLGCTEIRNLLYIRIVMKEISALLQALRMRIHCFNRTQ